MREGGGSIRTKPNRALRLLLKLSVIQFPDDPSTWS